MPFMKQIKTFTLKRAVGIRTVMTFKAIDGNEEKVKRSTQDLTRK